MALTAFNLNTVASWTLSKTNSGTFAPTTYGPDNIAFAYTGTNAPSLTTYTEVYLGTTNLGASVSQDYNFNSFTDFTGVAVTATKILAIMVITSGPSTATAQLTASPANGLSWFLSGTTPAVNIPAGGMFIFANGGTNTPQAMSGSASSMRITNTGTGTLSVNLVALVGP